MKKAPSPQKPSTRLKTGSGPGTLTWAWLGFAALLLAGAALIQLIDWDGDDEGTVTIALDEEPERFARPLDVDAGRLAMQNAIRDGSGISQAADTPAEQSGSDLPTVRPARPGEFNEERSTSPDATEPETETEALSSEGDNAAVIRVEDLPRPGESRPARQTGAIRVAGTPPGRPDPALWQETGNGPLPKIAQDGRRPSRYYARTFAASEGAPRLGLIVSGLGLSRPLTDRAITALPAEASLAFAPYARDLATISQTARADGHELMVEIPMEAAGIQAESLGPAGLMTTYSAQDNLRRLDWMLTRFTGYFGVTTYLGASFTADEEAMSPVLDRLRGSGLAYISDNRPAGGLSLGSIPSTNIQHVISGSGDTLAEDLKRLEEEAGSRGAILAKIYVTEDNIDTVAAWARELKDRGIALAPASAMLN